MNKNTKNHIETYYNGQKYSYWHLSDETTYDDDCNKYYKSKYNVCHPGPQGPPGLQGPQGPPGPGPSILTGIGIPTCAIGEFGDIYIDLSTGKIYLKLVQPISPSVRSIPAPTGSTINVPSGIDTIQPAITAASNGDLLVLAAGSYTITATINVNKSITIEGAGTSTIVSATSLSGDFMFNVTQSNVVFKNMKIVQNYNAITSVETVIAVNNLAATGIYVDNCDIGVCSLGIVIKATEFQITNCNFTLAPSGLPLYGGYFDISISSTSGESIIAYNTFEADFADKSCRFIIITNISGTIQNKLLISNNTQTASLFMLRHLLVIEEYTGSNFELYINNNTTIYEGNVPVLLYEPGFSLFKFIEVDGNSIKDTAGKGLIGIDADPPPSPIFSTTGTTDIFSSNNALADPHFLNNPPNDIWASATIPASFIVGYNSAVISPSPGLPLQSCYWLNIG